MKSRKLYLNFKNRKFLLNVKDCNPIERIKGLMFSSRNSEVLLFRFKKPTKMSIHSFFVFFSFIAVWLNEEEKIIDFKIVKPFNFSVKPKEKFLKLVEIPLNDKNSEVIKILVGDRKI